MIRVSPRLRRVSIATFILIFAAGPARAEPAAPGPVPAPYPNVASPDAAGQDGVAFKKKHIGSVKYNDLRSSDPAAPAGDAQVLEVQSLSWGKIKDAGTVYSADPMEGGQIAREASKPKVGEINVTKLKDAASAPMMSADASEPGKLEVPNLAVSEPLARGTATFKTLAGACATGKHLSMVKIVARSGSYTLHDAIVTDVSPAGDGMEQVSVSYDSLGD